MADGSQMPHLTGATPYKLAFPGTLSATEDEKVQAVERELRWFLSPLPSSVSMAAPIPFTNTAPVPINRQQRRRRHIPRSYVSDFRAPRSLDARLAARAGDLKIQVNRVAMHLTEALRADLVRGLSDLLAIDNWDSEMAFPADRSLGTLLKFLTYLRPANLPSLGASDDGTLVASWRDSESDLFVEFLQDGLVRWVASRSAGGKRERVAGVTGIESLAPGRTPFVDRWFAPRG